MPAWPHEAAGFISLGGAMHAHQTHQFPFLCDEIKLLRHVIHEGGAVWGVCLGAQLVCEAAGGDVYKLKAPEVGWVSVEKEVDDPLLHNVSSPFTAFCWHEYACKVPSHLAPRGQQRRRPCRSSAPAAGRGPRSSILRSTPPSPLTGWTTRRRTSSTWTTAWHDKLRADTADNLSANATLCRQITENFVVHSGLLRRAERRERPRTQDGGAVAPPSCTRFRAAPRGRGACERSHGVVLGSTSVREGCVEGDSITQSVYYHHRGS